MHPFVEPPLQALYIELSQDKVRGNLISIRSTHHDLGRVTHNYPSKGQDDEIKHLDPAQYSYFTDGRGIQAKYAFTNLQCKHD